MLNIFVLYNYMTKNKNEIFQERAKKIWGNRFSYEQVNYINNRIKVCITCLEHGSFWQTPNNHLAAKEACKHCSNFVKKDKDFFISKCKKIHGDKYNYSEFNYINSKIKGKIICHDHGEFWQTPSNHYAGKGCPVCAKVIISSKLTKKQERWLFEVNIKHNFCYDYSTVNYVNGKSPVCIICSKHGEFWQRPQNHLLGSGCPKCISVVSKPEQEWLNYLKVPLLFRKNQLIKVFDKSLKPDAVDKKNKIIWEFYGDFWHGNPNKFNSDDINKISKKTFGELYQKTIEKEELFKNAGYQVISIWETEWNEIKKKLKD